MKHSNRIALFWGAVVALTMTSCAPHTVFLHPAVAPADEEALNWCGPATAQMVMAGYPSGACNKAQHEAWAEIDSHRVEAVWDTDPAGLRTTLANLCPPVGSWGIFHRTDATKLMFSVAYYMTKNEYPVALLLDTNAHNSYTAHQENWVTVKGIGTDADPTTTSTVDLRFVWLIEQDGELLNHAVDRFFLTGADFYARLQPVAKATSTYNNEYVAVIEPPTTSGQALAPAPVLSGNVIRAERARRAATRVIRAMRLARWKPFAELPRARALDLQLVSPDEGGYFVIPFALEGEPARWAILVNAYTGKVQEVVAFHPRRFLAEKEALAVARESLGLAESTAIRGELDVFSEIPSARTYRPVWKFEIEGRSVLVGQNGTVRADPRIQ